MRASVTSIDRQVLQGDPHGRFGMGSIRRRSIRGVGDDPSGDTITLDFPQTDSTPAPTASPINWTSVLNTADNSLSNLLKITLTPQTKLIQTPQGSYYSSPNYIPGQPVPGGVFSASVPGSTLFSSASLLPWLLIGGVVLIAMSRR